jgi:hypothetical protein
MIQLVVLIPTLNGKRCFQLELERWWRSRRRLDKIDKTSTPDPATLINCRYLNSWRSMIIFTGLRRQRGRCYWTGWPSWIYSWTTRRSAVPSDLPIQCYKPFCSSTPHQNRRSSNGASPSSRHRHSQTATCWDETYTPITTSKSSRLF